MPSASNTDPQSHELKDMLVKKDAVTVQVASRSNSDASDASELEPIISPFKEYSTIIADDDSTFQLDLEDLPQGRNLGLFSTIVLFIARIIGSGIWTTPSAVLLMCGGNLTAFFALWIIAAIVAFSGLYVYLELGSIIPRSGGTKVFLEFIYQRPKYLVSVVFGLYSLAFGMCLSNALVFGKYALYSFGVSSEYIDSSKSANLVGLALVLVSTIVHGVSVHHGIFVQNILGFLKLLLVAIMVFTSLYVLCFPQKLTGLENHLHYNDFFQFQDSSIVSVSTISAGLLQCFFTFGGWNSVHTVASEIKDPVRTIKIAGPVSLSIAFVNYMLINVAYLKVVPYDEFVKAGPLIGSIFFEKVLGHTLGRQFVTVSIALSSASNVFVVIYGVSRMNQEIFREGYLPFTKITASNYKHTNTPLFSLILCCAITTFWLLILPPQGNSYNYIVSLEGYPTQIFIVLIAVGLFVLRKRYPDKHAPIRASLVGTSFIVIISMYVLIAPFTAPTDPSTALELLPPYHILGLLLLGLCVGYWAIMFKVLPNIRGYQLEKNTIHLEDGLSVKEWVKVWV